MTLRRLFIGALAALCALLSPLAHANTTTANLGLNKPAVGGDSDNWGTYLNANADALDGEFAVVAKGDASYTILSTDRVVRLTTAFTAGRTFTLPAAAALKASQPIVIVDAAGAISSTNPLTIARAGADTIDGATSFSVTSPYSVVVLRSDGVSAWTVAGVPTTGTWTPTLTAATTPPTGVTYGAQSGYYTRIGNVVFFTGTLTVTSLGTGAVGTARISLPFTSSQAVLVAPFRGAGYTLTAGNILCGTIGSGVNAMGLQEYGANGRQDVDFSFLTNSFNVSFSGFLIL